MRTRASHVNAGTDGVVIVVGPRCYGMVRGMVIRSVIGQGGMLY
jgi:hypothetical protein